jgi:hypothetical protein
MVRSVEMTNVTMNTLPFGDELEIGSNRIGLISTHCMLYSSLFVPPASFSCPSRPFFICISSIIIVPSVILVLLFHHDGTHSSID